MARILAEFKEQAAESTQIGAEYVLKRLKEIDELDVIDILNDDMGSFKPVKEWPKAWRISISGVDIQHLMSNGEEIDTLVKKIKWPDKTKNLELLGRHVDVQAFKDRVEVGASENLASLILEGRKRVNSNE